jgi:uncharacterized membrane protein
MEIFEVFGRLHPLILHLPIGILALAFLMELVSRKEAYKELRPAIGFAIQIGMLSAIFAAISGYVLSLEGGYDDELLWQHKWLGIGTAVVAIVVYLFHGVRTSKAGKKLYLPLFGGLMFLMGAAGHLGGSLTHGTEFLLEPLSNKAIEKTVITDINNAKVFADIIQPIFEQKCVTCHSPSKMKGKLLMSTIAGLQKGGETSAFLQAGSVINSLFLQRAHLPLEEKEHMPPKGKKQLSSDEITLLEWWVEQGAHFDKKIEQIKQTEEIKAILKKYERAENSVLTLDIEAADERTIKKLKAANIKVNKVLEDKPFLVVSLRDRKDLNTSTFNQLKQISEQTVELDLSNTNLTDDLFSELKDFPHLQKISAQKTEISGSGFNVLSDLKYLENLNVYDTNLEDAVIPFLAKLTNLKKLYLWDTNISRQGIEQLKKVLPNVDMNTGIDKSIFGEGELQPPLILAEEDIFEDSLRVEFKLNFKEVDLFYTLDGSTPDSTSLLYVNPFLITESSDIQVVAQKEGWKKSSIAEKSFIRAGHRPQVIHLNKKPNEKYAGEGGISLIDLKKGTTDFTGGEWLGYQKSHFEATLDMGVEKEISSVAVSALEAASSYIFFPKGIEILKSSDGKSYQIIATRNIPSSTELTESSTKNFLLKFSPITAKFLKVKIKSNLVNPDWHPAPGAPCWVFVDEIMVE